jgi:hypothetical protein
MRLSDFIMLEEEEKKYTVLHEGVLVAKRCSYNYLVFLFQLDRFYVETFCNVQNKSIEEYRVFDTTTPLDPYLDHIQLEQLLN